MANGDFKNRSWITDNILGIVIAAGFTGFWFQYQADRKDTASFRTEIVTEQEKLNMRQLTVCQILINDPDTDPYFVECLREWIRLETRGDGKN